LIAKNSPHIHQKKYQKFVTAKISPFVNLLLNCSPEFKNNFPQDSSFQKNNIKSNLGQGEFIAKNPPKEPFIAERFGIKYYKQFTTYESPEDDTTKRIFITKLFTTRND
jgi:hypothetical protein